MHCVQSVRLDRHVLILLRHQNTVLLVPTAKRLVALSLRNISLALLCLSALVRIKY